MLLYPLRFWMAVIICEASQKGQRIYKSKNKSTINSLRHDCMLHFPWYFHFRTRSTNVDVTLAESLIASFARKRNMQHCIWVKVPSAVCDGVDLWWHGLHRKASRLWMWKLSKKCRGLQSSNVMLQQIPEWWTASNLWATLPRWVSYHVRSRAVLICVGWTMKPC